MNKKELSASETLIMKVIWAAGNEISLSDLLVSLKGKNGKDYARTTILTYMVRLSDKRFVETWRDGRYSYARALKTEDEYRREVAERDTDLWFSGKPVGFLSALHSKGRLGEEEIRQIKEYLDDLDD